MKMDHVMASMKLQEYPSPEEVKVSPPLPLLTIEGGHSGDDHLPKGERRTRFLVADQGKKMETNHDHCKLGVSVHYLIAHFMEEVLLAGLRETSKIYEIENLDNKEPGVIRKKGLHIVSPTDNRLGAAYVHCLKGDDNVGIANFMLSYTWDYEIGDIIDTLRSYCDRNKLNPKRTYIWLCCLCINQHRVAEKKKSGMLVPTNVFFEEFQARVVGIGHLLAMMAPWKEPKYLTRIWCIFEIYIAHKHQNDCQVTIVMPRKQKEQLEYDLLSEEGGGIQNLYETLAKTKIEDAKATIEDDRTAILEMVQRKDGPGFHSLNNQVNELLRSWVLSSTREAVKCRLEDESSWDEEENKISQSFFCNQVGHLLRHHDELDEALIMYRKALVIDESVLGTNHQDTATSYSCIGSVLHDKGDYNEALIMYRKGLAIRESVLGLNHQDTARSYNKIGAVLRIKGEYDEALIVLRKALEIRESVLGVNHKDTATSYNNIGSVFKDQDNYNKAETMYRKALVIDELVLGTKHQDTAFSYSCMGSVLHVKRNYDEALNMHRKALTIRESVLGVKHQDTATSYNHIGAVLHDKGDLSEALGMHDKALHIRESVLGLHHPDTAKSYNNIGSVLHDEGKWDDALVMYRKAFAIFELTLGVCHPSTLIAKNNVESCLPTSCHKD